jgi:HD-GYP domain-containing protein (c-di-GMP phosphodiesterase class II)
VACDAGVSSQVRERVGGGGYPECLLGEEIPLGARIVAVANTFDMLISGRPGRPARNQREALAALQAQAGSALDRRVVDTFVSAARHGGILRDCEPREPSPAAGGSRATEITRISCPRLR